VLVILTGVVRGNRGKWDREEWWERQVHRARQEFQAVMVPQVLPACPLVRYEHLEAQRSLPTSFATFLSTIRARSTRAAPRKVAAHPGASLTLTRNGGPTATCMLKSREERLLPTRHATFPSPTRVKRTASAQRKVSLMVKTDTAKCGASRMLSHRATVCHSLLSCSFFLLTSFPALPTPPTPCLVHSALSLLHPCGRREGAREAHVWGRSWAMLPDVVLTGHQM